MLDFYEGEQLRRSVLIRNALRRTTAQQTKRRTAAEVDALFYGDQATVMESITTVADADLNDDIKVIDDQATTQAPVRVNVTDYDYEYDDGSDEVSDEEDLDSSYDYSSDEEEEEQEDEHDDREAYNAFVAHDNKDEHSWFEDLLDEVSLEQPSIVSSTYSNINRAAAAASEYASLHGGDAQSDCEASTPSLIDDEGEDSGSNSGHSSSGDDDDDEAEHDAVLGRRLYDYSASAAKQKDASVVRPVRLSAFHRISPTPTPSHVEW